MKILYHADCLDGAGAALAAWMFFGDDGHEYIPVQHGSEPPDVADCDVLIVDFSYQRNVLVEMSKTAKSIRLIDHHKTAREDLEEIDSEMHCPTRILFDMKKSGAVLAWEELHTASIPHLLVLIEDRDLWQFKYPETSDICTGLQLCRDWKEWLKYIDEPAQMNHLVADGSAINRYLRIQADKIIDSTKTLETWDITGDTIPLYNLPGFMISDTLHMALEKFPDAPYAVAYFDLPATNKRVYSLRSRKGSDIDVSEIAKANGGGGHKHAAGFTT